MALLATILFVAALIIILRLVLNPNEDTMRASVEQVRTQREAVVVRAAVPTEVTAETPTESGEASTSDLPGVGDTLIDSDGVEVTLVSVDDIAGIQQFQARAKTNPRKDLFRVVTFKVTNNSNDVQQVNNTKIAIITADGSSTGVDTNSTSLLGNTAAVLGAGRPLFLLEAVAVGRSALLSVSFDLEQTTDSLVIDIHGLHFSLPAINLDDGSVVADDTPAGSSRDAANMREARIEGEEQTAVSRTGLPTVGDTVLGDDGLEVTLVSVQQFEELAQVHGTPFRPKNGAFKLATVKFKNTTASSNIIVSKDNIFLIDPSGAEISVDSPGVNALIGMATTATEGRPLFLIESVPDGKTVIVAVVFDLAPDLIDLNIQIEGFLFEVPNP